MAGPDIASQPLAGSRVVVTGGAGFIGSHLTEELVRRGAEVAVVDDLSKGRLENIAAVADRIELVRLDLREQAFSELLGDRSPDVVFHLAGFASVPDSVRAVRTDFEQNAEATLSLLEAARAVSPAARIVFASSAAVYGEGSERPLREEDPTLPLAPYGVSKLAAERYTSVYASVFGLRTAALRLFPVYGPRLRRHVVWDLLCKLRDDPGALTLEGDGTEVRDFTYIVNAVEALVLVAERAPLAGEVYNASDGAPLAIRDLAERLAALMEADPRITCTGDVRPGVSRVWVADTSRVRALGFEPRVPLDEGLAETVAWFRSTVAATGP